MSHTASQKYQLYAKFSCSNLQLPAYTAYRSLQKITKSDGQAPNQTLFPRILWEPDVTLMLLCYFGSSSFGWCLGGFGWFLLVEGDFGWFQVVCCFSSYISFTACRTLNSLLYSQSHVIDQGHSVFLFKVKQQEKNCCCLVAQPSKNK